MHEERMTVTPELAKLWLSDRNNRNRNIRESKVSAYADDMAKGRWLETHQNCIAFYEDGNLADGQHRLSAIVQSGASIEMRVFFGLERKVSLAIDGHGQRNAEDQIRIAGVANWISKDEIAVCRMILQLTPSKSVKRVISPQFIVDFLNDHKARVQFAVGHLPTKTRGLITAPVRAAVALAYSHVDRGDLETFCSVLCGEMPSEPRARTVITLRERFLRENMTHSAAARALGCKLTMRAIQAFCAGEVLTKLYEPRGMIYEL
jgi:hypothetical protein